ncbi:MAG: BspA family leucine-rich repeat surface protein, partial [Campylobacterota bacterium]|nr:BspA family leucine-rich repeat surface protein [Campylobacterota bacterium]
MNKLLILVVMFLLGCGGGGSTAPTQTPPQEVNSNEQNITIDETNISTQERGFGALSTPKDILDRIPLAYVPSGSSGDTLPSSIDLSPHMPPVGDQGSQNSCVGWAVGYYLKSYQEHIEHNQAYGLGGDYTHRYSPAFIYNMSKIGSCESGAYLLDALLLLKDTGVSPWKDMPYEPNHCNTPSDNAIEKAICAQIDNIKRLDINSRHFVSNVRYFLYQNEPIVITLKPYKGFINPKLYEDEYWYRELNLDESPPAFLHSVLIVGYDDRRRAFKVINSWGEDWGNSGYLWISYSLLQEIIVEAFWAKDAISPCVIENSQIKEVENTQQADNPVVIDSTPLTLNISDNVSSIATAQLINQEWVADRVTFAFEFSKNVVEFESSDIMVSNGAKSNFRGEGNLYYLDVTPPLHSNKTIVVSIATNSIFDSYGNGNQAMNHNQEVNTIKPFITTWDTTEVGITNSDQIKIGTNQHYNYNYRIDWGDGEQSSSVRGDITHTYQQDGVYTVSITGTFPAIYFENEGYDNGKLLSIDQWGTQPWHSMHKAFYYTINMVGNFNDTPNLRSVTDLSYMFANTYHFNSNIGHWNVSSVIDMSAMFKDAQVFNQNIGNWDVSNVTNMSDMFKSANLFNSDLSHWNVSNVTDMSDMFNGARNFNQDIGNWNVSNVTDMSWMFNTARSFDSDLSNWNISNVMSMSLMFNYANLSTQNYNKILDKWSQLNLQDGVYFNLGSTMYDRAYADKRQYIIDTFNWTIS